MKHEIRKVTKLGGSLVISIPSMIAKKFGIKEGDYVIIYDNGDEIILEPL